MTANQKKQSLLGFIIFLILSLGWFTFSLVISLKAFENRNWPTTEGTVISASVKRLNSQKGTPKFKPVISYAYQLGNARYTSTKYCSSLGYGKEEWAEKIVSDYLEGKQVTVHYNAENPSRSVLVTGPQRSNIVMMLISGGLFLFIFFAFLRQLKKTKLRSAG